MKLEKVIIIIALIGFTLFTINTCKEMNQKDFGIADTSSRTVSAIAHFDSSEIVIIHDSIPITDSIFVATNLQVDTAEVIRRYLTAYFYQDTVRNQDLSMVISDSLFNNRLTYRHYQYKILRPDSIITKETTIRLPVKLPVIFTGIGIGITGNTLTVIPKISFSNTKGYLFEGGIILNQLKPGFYAGINYKIK